MKIPFERAFVSELKSQLQKFPQFIHIVLGPRQVGKTTAVLQLIDRLFEGAFLLKQLFLDNFIIGVKKIMKLILYLSAAENCWP
jgi:predicted AAA+ superfamily ATPase